MFPGCISNKLQIFSSAIIPTISFLRNDWIAFSPKSLSFRNLVVVYPASFKAFNTSNLYTNTFQPPKILFNYYTLYLNQFQDKYIINNAQISIYFYTLFLVYMYIVITLKNVYIYYNKTKGVATLPKQTTPPIKER